MTDIEEAKKVAPLIKNISIESAIQDYENLKLGKEHLTGIRALDYFFLYHRLLVMGHKGYSFIDLINNKNGILENNCIQSLLFWGVEKYKNDIECFRSMYDGFLLYLGTVNHFRPAVARDLYKKYNAKKVLDFCAGWGGRCLGAMALDIEYIGIDSNYELKNAYNEMVITYPSNSKITMIYDDCRKVDYSKIDYDFVLTSPPYWRPGCGKPLEQYRNMPDYVNYEKCMKEFIFVIVKKVWDNLRLGGTMCLNLPKYMYDDLIKVVGESVEQIKLPKCSRGSRQNDNYEEYIYVWQKKSVELGWD